MAKNQPEDFEQHLEEKIIKITSNGDGLFFIK